jgi:hypothetical protein
MFEKKEKPDLNIDIRLSQIDNLNKQFESFKKDFDELEKRVKELDERTKPMSAIITGLTEETFQKLLNICSDISAKDETFVFDGNREALEVYIYGKDKDILHKRAMWLIKKTGIDGLRYRVD